MGMRSGRIGIIAMLFAANLFPQVRSTITPSPDPLTPEQMSIYRMFLNQYNNGSKAILNIAQDTVPFDADEDDFSGCMKTFARNSSHASIRHTFRVDAFEKQNARLVDPEKHAIRDPGDAIGHGESVDSAVEAGFREGLFTFSEIVFNRSHTRAAFSYSFHCGRLCGHGETVIFEVTRGQWMRSKAQCGPG